MSEHTPLTEAERGALREWALGVKRHNARCSIEPDTLLDLLDLAARTSTATADTGHSHETGGAWNVTRWAVPGCAACNPQAALTTDTGASD